MKWFIIPVFFATAASVTNVARADAWIKCAGCTPSQMLDKSQRHVRVGNAVVYDAATSTALRFSNEQAMIGGPHCQHRRPESSASTTTNKVERAQQIDTPASGCRVDTVSTSEPLTLQNANVLNALHSIHAQTNGSIKSIIDLNANDIDFGPGPITSPAGGGPGFGPSAADYANSADFRARVNNFAAQFAGGSESMVTAMVANTYVHLTQPWNVITSASGMFWLGEDATITVVIRFDDGTKVAINFEFETPDIARDAVALDSEGRDIMTPSNVADFSDATFRFPNGGGAALENWIQNAIHLGIPVVGITSPTGPGGCRRIVDGVACTRLRL